MCESREVESVFHVIVECEKYEQERQVFIDEVNAGLEGLLERWSEDEQGVMCILLGITGEANDHMIEALKEFLMKIWQKRKSNTPRNDVMANDHLYIMIEE